VGDRYELREELGSGGMATVWLGWDTRLNRTVAVKLLANVLAADKTFVARFEREAQLAAGLSHPNVVTVFDFGTDDGSPYIVMEAVDGESLARRLHQRGPLSEFETAKVCDGVLAALQLAHDRGIVHRDIKPSNILLGSDGTVKVADFGIARLTSDATQLTDTGVMIGTVAYLSPEQCAGAKATPLSDIYGLGCVAYQCVTGRPPFAGETPASVMYQHQHVAPRPLRELAPSASSAMQTVVMTALEKTPSDRFSSADEMRQALSVPKAAGATATLKKPSNRTTEVIRPPSSSTSPLITWRVAAFLGAIVLLLGGIGVGIALVASSQPSSHSPNAAQGGSATSSPIKTGRQSHTATNPTNSTATTTTTVPTTTTTAITTDQVLPVVSCPTTYAGGQTPVALPPTESASLPSGIGTSYQYYWLSDADLHVLAPAGWTCSGTQGADGGASMAVVPPSEPATTDPTAANDPIAISASSTGGCQGCAYGAVCPYFSSANTYFPFYAQSPGCSRSIPNGESSGLLNQEVAYFEDPPGVSGSGTPSGGGNPANGIIVFLAPNPGNEASVYSSSCTLPQSEHAECTAVLNSFAHDYQST
jgi:serine/threonine-protein kinase